MKNEAPQNSSSSDSVGKELLLAFGRGIIYAVCFLVAYAVLYRPFFSGSASASASNASASYEKQQADQVRVYQEQVARTNAMFSESERQQKRMAEVLSKQEELAKRLDAVMSAWEKQSGVKK